MPKQKEFSLKLGKPLKPISLRADARRVSKVREVEPTTNPAAVFKALKASPGGKEIVAQHEKFAAYDLWSRVASFSVCAKTGTALYLDIWDADHFDGFTDMQRCVNDCRAWFSANGYTYWGSSETKTGRINCYFTAPDDGDYICTAELQSYGGSAMVECLIDDSSFGFLPFNGTKVQPHPCSLLKGGHSFRIRQASGSFFFLSLTVWRA